MRKILQGLFLLVFIDAGAQEVYTTNDTLVQLYNTDRRSTLPIYNGRQFSGYSPQIEGFPYSFSNDWQTGSVLYDGIWYHDLPIMYDAYQDQVVAKSPNGFPFVIISEKIERFILAGHEFVRITSGLPTGFYHLVVEGPVTMYVKRIKQLDEKISGLTVERKFIPEELYFLKKGETVQRIRRQGDLFDVLKDRKQDIQQFMRKEDLKFKNNTENVIALVAEYYNKPGRTE